MSEEQPSQRSKTVPRYPKIKRLPIYRYPYRKEVMPPDSIKLLFSGRVVVEEKIDGKIMFGEFEQFIVFYEYMGIKHEIHYTKLPSFQIAFDVYDKSSKKFLDIREKHRVLRSLGFCYVPVVYAGTIDASSWESVIQDLMRRPSYYGAPLMEGVVIKNYERGIMAKAINKEFDEAIRGKEHYSRRRVVMHNKIYHGEEWEKLCYPEPITHP